MGLGFWVWGLGAGIRERGFWDLGDENENEEENENDFGSGIKVGPDVRAGRLMATGAVRGSWRDQRSRPTGWCGEMGRLAGSEGASGGAGLPRRPVGSSQWRGRGENENE